MKSAFVVILILQVIFFSCGPIEQTTQGQFLQDIKIRIEFANRDNARQIILQALRPARPKDLETVGDDSNMKTEAIFANVSPRDFEVIKRIEQQLLLIPGVFNVELMRPTRPVMQTIDHPVTP